MDVLFLDLDDTLYPRSNGLWQAIGDRILLFVSDRLGVSAAQAEQIRSEYLERYGTTLHGLLQHHDVDPLDYLDFVHEMPLEKYLAPDPGLRDLLQGLPLRKAIFTNAPRRHVEGVLDRLGIGQAIDQIIDIFSLQMKNKPLPDSYRIALDLAGGPAPERCAIVDDLARNLGPAARLGMNTILVGPDDGGEGISPRIRSIHELPLVLPPFS